VVAQNYAALDQHFNAVGLRSTGVVFLSEMMKRGMIIDLDHFSQRGRIDAFAAMNDFGNQALGTSGQDGVDYPAFGVHTDIRGMTRHGPVPNVPALRDAFGYGTELDRTDAEFVRVAQNGGAFSPGANAGLVNPNVATVPDVRNDCDFSSKSFAVKYLEMMKRM